MSFFAFLNRRGGVGGVGGVGGGGGGGGGGGSGGSAPVARDRIKVLLAHERAVAGGSDLAAVLHEEILAVITKHMPIERDKVQVKLDRGGEISTLEIDVELPSMPARADVERTIP